MQAALILARMDSQRLPNKALKILGDRPLVQWCIDGVKNIDVLEPILLTTDRAVDEPLLEVAKQNGIRAFAGDTYNVARRVLDAIDHFEIDLFARINGDSPIIHRPLLLEGLELMMQDESCELVTNLVPRKFPYGMSVELLRAASFRRHYANFTSVTHQEHITSWFYEHPNEVNMRFLTYPGDNLHHLRLVVDTPEDFARMEQLLTRHSEIDFNNQALGELVKYL